MRGSLEYIDGDDGAISNRRPTVQKGRCRTMLLLPVPVVWSQERVIMAHECARGFCVVARLSERRAVEVVRPERLKSLPCVFTAAWDFKICRKLIVRVIPATAARGVLPRQDDKRSNYND